MCFSATASFAAWGLLAVVGVATLGHVRQPRALLFATVPLLFAVHQFTEGFVWLGLNGSIGPVALGHVTFLFMLYAQGILPLLMPLAVLLMEPAGWRRKAIVALTIVGALVCAWMVYGLIAFESRSAIEHLSIAYRNPATGNLVVSLLYILATCGAFVLSTHRVVSLFGVLNVIGLTIAKLLKEYAFASVWCFYAAILSVVIYWQFRRMDIDVAAPNSPPPIFRPLLLPWLRFANISGVEPDNVRETDS